MKKLITAAAAVPFILAGLIASAPAASASISIFKRSISLY